MTPSQMAENHLKDLQALPEVWIPLTADVEKALLEIEDKIKEILKTHFKDKLQDLKTLTTAGEFYEYLAKLISIADGNQGMLEIIEPTAIKLVLEKIIEPAIKKMAGNDWYSQYQNYLGALINS